MWGNRRHITFTTNETLNVSTALEAIGIEHDDAVPLDANRSSVMRAYYETVEEAEALLNYIVSSAAADDKMLWQQDRAHDEIAGWCELCQAANAGECDGCCLINHRTQPALDFLFLRAAKRPLDIPAKEDGSRSGDPSRAALSVRFTTPSRPVRIASDKR